MPHVIVKLYPGRSEEQKMNLAESITKVVSENLNSKYNLFKITIIGYQKAPSVH